MNCVSACFILQCAASYFNLVKTLNPKCCENFLVEIKPGSPHYRGPANVPTLQTVWVIITDYQSKLMYTKMAGRKSGQNSTNHCNHANTNKIPSR